VKNLTIARRYAKALLIIGKEDGQAETYRKELDGFARMISGEKELGLAICNPLYSASGRKKVLETVVDKVGVSKVV
jgi:F-type H+-transporting ATPase subunit delta